MERCIYIEREIVLISHFLLLWNMFSMNGCHQEDHEKTLGEKIAGDIEKKISGESFYALMVGHTVVEKLGCMNHLRSHYNNILTLNKGSV